MAIIACKTKYFDPESIAQANPEVEFHVGPSKPLSDGELLAMLQEYPCLGTYLDALPDLLEREDKVVIISAGKVVGRGTSDEAAIADMKINTGIAHTWDLPSPRTVKTVAAYDIIQYFRYYYDCLHQKV